MVNVESVLGKLQGKEVNVQGIAVVDILGVTVTQSETAVKMKPHRKRYILTT